MLMRTLLALAIVIVGLLALPFVGRAQNDPLIITDTPPPKTPGEAIAQSVAQSVNQIADQLPVQQVVPQTREEISLSFAPLVKQAAPAVVNIYATAMVKQRAVSSLFSDDFMAQMFGDVMPPGMTRERLAKSLGSGVLVSSDGLIVTSHHVVDGATAIRVALADKREFEATLVSSDAKTDLAVLKINTNGEKLPYLPMKDSDAVQVGDLVLAIGNPFAVGQTVTSGIISAVARTDVGINDLNYFIQTDAAINPGNSGGALVSMEGKLVGINSAIFSRTGGSMGIGFAIPANMVRTVIASAESGQKNVVRPWLGLQGQDVTQDIASSLGLARPYGVLVNQLNSVSPFAKASIKVGDVILAINGKEIEDVQALRFRIATLPVGGVAKVKVHRGGRTLDLAVQMISPPEDPPRQTTTVAGKNPLMGSVIANLSPAVADELGLDVEDPQGVVITSIQGQSAAASIGIRKGDIIININGDQIKQVSDAVLTLKRPTQVWQIQVNRGGQRLSVVIQ